MNHFSTPPTPRTLRPAVLPQRSAPTASAVAPRQPMVLRSSHAPLQLSLFTRPGALR